MNPAEHESIVERVMDELGLHHHESEAAVSDQSPDPAADPNAVPPADPQPAAAPENPPESPAPPADPAPAPDPAPAGPPPEHPDNPDHPTNQVQPGPVDVPPTVGNQINDPGPDGTTDVPHAWEGGDTLVDTGWLPDGTILDSAWAEALAATHGYNADGSVATPSNHLPIADAALVAAKAVIGALAPGGESRVGLHVDEGGDDVHVEITVDRRATPTS